MLERTPLFAESWNVAWRKKPTGSLLTDFNTTFNVIDNDRNYWAADPFLFDYNDDIYIFAELYDYKLCRGCIGYTKWNGKSFDGWTKVITEEFHLSYPFIFEYDGEIYILPESGADNSLFLYKAIVFPSKWKKERIIKQDIIFADTTPFIYDKHKYALTYDVKEQGGFHITLLDIENDTEKSLDYLKNQELRRPAGRFFEYNNSPVRPAQICINDYGEGLVFYNVTIDNNQYTETEVERITPNNLSFSKKMPLDGMHTYNSSDEFEVIDIKTRRLNLKNLFYRFLSKLQRNTK